MKLLRNGPGKLFTFTAEGPKVQTLYRVLQLYGLHRSDGQSPGNAFATMLGQHERRTEIDCVVRFPDADPVE